MWNQCYRILLILIGTGLLHVSYGCSVDGVEWGIPVTREINDTFAGIFFSSVTQDIQDFTLIQNEGLNGGPYVEVLINNSNSLLTIATNTNFASYEEIETEKTMRYTINFRCTNSMRGIFILVVNIKDTNNNDPGFLQSQYDLQISLPVPPGFLLTGCQKDIIVRDIDLTTQKIDFQLDGSDLFEISYDPSSQVPKEFKSILRTTTLIRSIPETITLTLTATDVDLTGDPPRSTVATVIIKADNEFQFPNEPMFSRPYYLAVYERNNNIILQDTIYLDQGYDKQVEFSLESDYSEYFNLVVDDNKVQFSVKNPLPLELYKERHIYLVVNAERVYTNGAAATVVLNLPEDISLEFERAIYGGKIEDDVLVLTDLILKQGYEDANITVDVRSEYAFRANVQTNAIIISMDPLAEEIIRNNNFINFEIFASNNRTTAATAVTLEIIKDDYITPIFERHVYNASYSEAGLIIEDIILIQGFDKTVDITIEGEYSTYFKIVEDGPRVKLEPLDIPDEILMEPNLILSVVASKPRTVGAHTTVNIAMPSARSLVFEKDFYIGNIEKKNVTIDKIVLTDGYSTDINFTLTGEHANYFSTNNDQNIITIVVRTELPETVVFENDIIVLTLVASGTNAVTTSTSIVIQIIKEDYRTPVFNDQIYSIKYENDKLSTVNMTLIQGFDNTVTFELKGDHTEFFSFETSFNSIKLSLNSTIPRDIIFNEKVIILNVVARKPRTVGANAVVYITFPREMTEPALMSFARNAYNGTLEDGILNVEDVILEFGYTQQTEFDLSGYYTDYFSLNITNNIVTVMLKNNISLEEIEKQDVITLEITATAEKATPTTTVLVVYINKNETAFPVFKKAFYKGNYTKDEGLVFNEIISLEEGFDNTVEFILEEEYSQWFFLEQDENSIILRGNTTNPIPEVILENNLHLIFTIFARKPYIVDGRTAIYIDLPKEYPSVSILEFEKRQYIGTIEKNKLNLEEIGLLGADHASVEFNLTGDFSTHFTITENVNSISINYLTLPEEIIDNNTFIVLNIEASRIDAIAGHATIIVDIVKNQQIIVIPIFEKAFYTGQYFNSTGLEFQSSIKLAQGFDKTVTFDLMGEDSQWFTLVENGTNDLSIQIKNDSISEITGRSYLVFTVNARKLNMSSAHAAVIISLKENNILRILQFEYMSYVGHIEEKRLHVEHLRLLEGDVTSMKFNITGDYSNYFTVTKLSEHVEINMLEASKEILENDFIVLNIEVSEPGTVSGHTTVVIEIVKDINQNIIKPIFSKSYYTGEYSKETGLIFSSSITLVQGFNETVEFELEDDDSQWFTLLEHGPNNFTLNIKNDNINEIVGRSHLIFTVVAHKDNTTTGRATIVIAILENNNVRIHKFEQISYLGSIENKELELEAMRVIHGITSSTQFNITGDYAPYFTISKQTDSIQINLMDAPLEMYENDFLILNIKVFELGYISGHTTVVLSIIKESCQGYKNVTPVFSEAYYTGQYSKESGLSFAYVITLTQGFDDTVTFTLDSDDSKGFNLVENSLNNFTLNFNESLSDIDNRNYLLFTVTALKPNFIQGSAAIVISITGSPEADISFDKILYDGKLDDGVLSHDTITLIGYEGTNVIIIGEQGKFFEAELTKGVVKVSTTSSAEFPRELTYIALELQAASAKSVLLIDVAFSGIEMKKLGKEEYTTITYQRIQSYSHYVAENPDLPRVSFTSQSYFFWANVQQTGAVGKVEATADNDEDIEYSLLITNDHIASRLNIINSGVISITKVIDNGIYNFHVVATAMQSQVRATAPVLLRIIDTLPECKDEVGLSPLIVIEKVEEEAHYNLVVLNETEHQGCQYILTNVVPEDQSWLYVDGNRLHTKPIDREDKSIAFMTLSQIQVELTLKCDSDKLPAFAKRLLGADDRSYLYSYDYSPNKWVLTDTILYNAGRSFVNLIVTDINDNSPKFNGKENEIIFVGYPVPEIEEIVLPRALVELKATDADIGENAAIMYWSGEDNLAVSPNTGLVHVRNNANLENNSRLRVYAIDRNGQGNNGSMDIVVKLLNRNHIAVLTVRNSFLEDESNVLNDLSNAVGYEIKVLKAVVISDNSNEFTRRKRDVDADSGGSLQLYVYGLIESEPVDINKLTNDVNNSNVATITIARIISLEDHLDRLETCPVLERDIGLLAATIALAVFIIILIIAIAVYFFLKWRINKNYERFSNRGSSVSQISPPKLPVLEVPIRPRFNMEKIKNNEKRLQEMLQEPVESALDPETVDIKNPEKTLDEAIVNISRDTQLPIIIQSIDKLKDNNNETDDNDEYGEMTKPRKSVVTFNENVEKIIHIEDVNEDESSENSFEVYKF